MRLMYNVMRLTSDFGYLLLITPVRSNSLAPWYTSVQKRCFNCFLVFCESASEVLLSR